MEADVTLRTPPPYQQSQCRSRAASQCGGRKATLEQTTTLPPTPSVITLPFPQSATNDPLASTSRCVIARLLPPAGVRCGSSPNIRWDLRFVGRARPPVKNRMGGRNTSDTGWHEQMIPTRRRLPTIRGAQKAMGWDRACEAFWIYSCLAHLRHCTYRPALVMGAGCRRALATSTPAGTIRRSRCRTNNQTGTADPRFAPGERKNRSNNPL